jgi:outer membrane lipoprotein-sorting protein
VKSFYHFIALSLSLSLVYSAANATEDRTLNEILQKHLEAMGGLNNWSRIESIQMNGTIERGGQTVDIVIVKKQPNQIRATVTVPIPGNEDEAFQIIRAHDGKTAWTATRLAGALEMQKEALPQEAADELLADAGVFPPLIKLWRNNAKLKLAGTKYIDTTPHFIIRVTPKELPNEYTFYVSAENLLVTQYESTSPINGTTVTQLENYTEQQNVRIPTLNIIQSQQTGDSIMSTSSIKIGVGIYEEYFELGDPAPSTAKL